MTNEERPGWATSWTCIVHGSVGDINGPVHYELCPISGSVIAERERM